MAKVWRIASGSGFHDHERQRHRLQLLGRLPPDPSQAGDEHVARFGAASPPASPPGVG